MYSQNNIPTFYVIDSKTTLCSVHFTVSFNQKILLNWRDIGNSHACGSWSLASVKIKIGIYSTSISSLLQKEVVWKLNLTVL